MKEIWTMGELLVEIMRPKADVPFEKTDVFLGPYPSGAPAIFIDAAAKLGVKTGIIGGIGADGFGEVLKDRLTKDGVNCKYVEVLDGSTGVAFIAYRSDGSREYIFHVENTPAVGVKQPKKLEVGPPGYFHIMGCSLFMGIHFADEILATMNAFKEKGYLISFDPNIRTELLKGDTFSSVVRPVLESSSVLLPGKKELLMLAGKDSVAEATTHLFETYKNLSIIALKLGSYGCSIITREETLNFGAMKTEEVDPTGAGDCFDAGFLCTLLQGGDLTDAALTASAAGALNVKAFGPMEGEINKENIKKMIDRNRNH